MVTYTHTVPKTVFDVFFGLTTSDLEKNQQTLYELKVKGIRAKNFGLESTYLKYNLDMSLFEER